MTDVTYVYTCLDLGMIPCAQSSRGPQLSKESEASQGQMMIQRCACSKFQDPTTKITVITADYVRSRLRAIVEIIGKDKLGFKKLDIGLHSIRSGGAMAMFLSGTSVIIIMRVGRWSSEAFLKYIRDQVESFTADVSRKMLQHEPFFNLNPDGGTQNKQVPLKPSTTEETTSEDGVDSISFLINFNSLALNDQDEMK